MRWPGSYQQTSPAGGMGLDQQLPPGGRTSSIPVSQAASHHWGSWNLWGFIVQTRLTPAVSEGCLGERAKERAKRARDFLDSETETEWGVPLCSRGLWEYRLEPFYLSSLLSPARWYGEHLLSVVSFPFLFLGEDGRAKGRRVSRQGEGESLA